MQQNGAKSEAIHMYLEETWLVIFDRRKGMLKVCPCFHLEKIQSRCEGKGQSILKSLGLSSCLCCLSKVTDVVDWGKTPKGKTIETNKNNRKNYLNVQMRKWRVCVCVCE